MFSTPERLVRRTGKKGSNRFDYLQQLVTEFGSTDSPNYKHQILANLANFAYDPINYNFLRSLKVIDLFLDNLSEPDAILQDYAIAGLCNLCLDQQNKEYILHNNGINVVKECLTASDEHTVISALTTLMYLVTPSSKPDITAPDIVECVVSLSDSLNTRLRNLARVFLEDYCSQEQITRATEALTTHRIPLPPVTSSYGR